MSSPWVSRRRRPSSTSSNVGSANHRAQEFDHLVERAGDDVPVQRHDARRHVGRKLRAEGIDALFDFVGRDSAAAAPEHAGDDARVALLCRGSDAAPVVCAMAKLTSGRAWLSST